jgi:hypothetical protein
VPNNPGNTCIAWSTPLAGFGINTGQDDICPSQDITAPFVCNSYSVNSTDGFHLLVGIKAPDASYPMPDGGSRIRFYVDTTTTCPNPPTPEGLAFCEGGCNGDGALGNK